ncbi:hypothetical protein MferCBS31731_001282 [Microsporum ferrugineum]
MISPNARRQPSSSTSRQQINGSELVASNSTASRFLGSRPKAWMQNANNTTGAAPVITRRPSRPAPRPSPAAAAAVSTKERAPSNSDTGQKTTSCPPGSAEGPTPVSEVSGDAVSASVYLSPVSSESIFPPAVPITPGPVQPVQPKQPVQQEQAVQPLPSPNPSHKSDPRGTTPRAEPVTAEVTAQPAPLVDGRQTASPRPPPPPLRCITTPSQQNVPSLGSPLVVAAAQSNVHLVSDQDNHRDKRPRLAVSKPPALLSQTCTSPSPINNNNNNNGMSEARSAGPGPPKLQQPPIELSPQALNACVPFLNGVVSTFQSHEAAYIYLLRDACVLYDLQYLALHQLHCISAISAKKLPGFGAKGQRAVAIVLDMVCHKARASSVFLHYFSAFPSDFATITSQNQRYAAAIESIKRWAPSFADTWPKFFSKVYNRGYPPLIDEIIHELGVHSVIMQSVFYTACVSTLTVNRPAALREAWKTVRQKNIDFYQHRLRMANTSNPVSAVHIQGENSYLASMFQQIYAVYPPPGVAPIPSQATHHMNPQQTLYATPPGYPSTPQVAPFSVTNRQAMRFPAAASTRSQPTRPLPFQRQTTLPSQTSTAPSNTTARIHPSMPSTAAQPYPSPTRQPITVSTANFNNNPPLTPSNQAYAHPPAQHYMQPTPTAQPIGTPLFPPPNANALPPTNPSPTSSLHLSHLRVVNVSLSKGGSSKPGENLFQSFESFAISPTTLGWDQYNFQLPLTLSSNQYAALPRPLHPPNTFHIIQGIVDRSKIYQIRCVRSTDSQPLTEEKWVMAECSWPLAIYIHVNGVEHFFRRKFHFGKDLPVPINRALKCGLNEIKVALIGTPEERKGSTFAIAVEVIDVTSYKRAREAIQTLSLSQSLGNIVKRLTNNTADSDELCVIDDFITVALIDPFMARIFDIPVRTVSCKHNECFDLDTFLNTRLSRVLKRPHGMAEDWKCPICNEDARPKRLIIDQFLVHVREELARRKQLDDVTAIKIRADQTWGVITRQTNSVKSTRDSSLKVDETGVATTITISSPKTAQSPPEIIELD